MPQSLKFLVSQPGYIEERKDLGCIVQPPPPPCWAPFPAWAMAHLGKLLAREGTLELTVQMVPPLAV